MASAYHPPVTAVQVGSFFVGQYYQVLQRSPDFAHQFYTDASNMTLIDGSVVKTATEMLDIHSLIMSLGFKTIEIKTAHSIESWNSGVLVVVSGFVRTKESTGKKRFMQTFFLAPQEKGYFVLNDIFQFINEEPVQQNQAAILNQEHYSSELKHDHYSSELNHEHYNPDINREHDNSELKTDHYSSVLNTDHYISELNNDQYSSDLNHEHYNPKYYDSELIHEYHSERNASNPLQERVRDFVLGGGIQGDGFVPEVHAEESEAVDKYSIPEPEQPTSEIDYRREAEINIEESPASIPSSLNISRDPQPAPSEKPVEEPIKHTYASILRISKGLPRPSAPQPSSSMIVPLASEWDDTPQYAPVQSQSTMQEKLSPEAFDETPLLDDEYEATSVYVRNLPSSASASDLEQEFKEFGRIKPDGVLIKSRKEVGVCYAFVEFEDISGVHNAVKASPIQFYGRQIYVEERRPDAGFFRGRGRGRGRGGYQSEGSRGRFGSRSFGRGNWQDNAIMDYTGRSRANGVVQQGARQEWGILGPQGLRNGQHL